MFVIEKFKFAPFSLFLDASPLNPRCLLDNDIHIYTTYVKGWGRVVQAKEDMFKCSIFKFKIIIYKISCPCLSCAKSAVLLCFMYDLSPLNESQSKRIAFLKLLFA